MGQGPLERTLQIIIAVPLLILLVIMIFGFVVYLPYCIFKDLKDEKDEKKAQYKWLTIFFVVFIFLFLYSIGPRR